MPSPLFLDTNGSAPEVSFWLYLLPLVLGLVAVYLLLPRVRHSSPWVGAALAALALLSAGALWLRAVGPPVEQFLFYTFSAIAVVAGGMLVTQRNPARAAMAFALVILSTTGLFLLQAAPFLMAATIIVYAGAIIVTFLFVLMLAQLEGLSDADQRSREPLLASIAGFVLLGALLYVLFQTVENQVAGPVRLDLDPAHLDAYGRPLVPADNVAALGQSLFTNYLLAVELGGTLLLVATIGAIAITGRRMEGSR